MALQSANGFQDGVCFVKIVRVLKTTEEKHSTDRNIPSTSEHNAFDIEDDQDEVYSHFRCFYNIQSNGLHLGSLTDPTAANYLPNSI